MRAAATISMARVICDMFFAEPMRRRISRVLGNCSYLGGRWSVTPQERLTTDHYLKAHCLLEFVDCVLQRLNCLLGQALFFDDGVQDFRVRRLQEFVELIFPV